MAVKWLISVPIVLALSAGVLSCPVDNDLCKCMEIKNTESGVNEYVVDCQEMRIYEVPGFKKGRTVDKVLLGGNLITSIYDGAFATIAPSTIDLHANIITKLEDNAFRGLENSLKNLNLSINQLDVTKIKSILKAKSLEVLDLSDNNGRKLVDLSKGAFKGVSNLQKLFIRGNNIRSLNKSFDGLKELRHLDLQDNDLISLSHSLNGLTNLEVLDVSSNKLKPFPKEDIRKLSKLTDLDLQGNRIRKLSVGAFDKTPMLKRFSLGNNPIRDVESLNAPAFKAVTDTLIHLDIRDCKLEEAPVDVLKSVPGLESLDLSSNRIKSIPEGAFSGMTSLKCLNISGNPLSFASGMFGGIEGTLEELYIQNLNLKDLPLEELKPLKKLERIVASSNDLSAIKDTSLKGLPTWKYVLASNNIRYIAPGAFTDASRPVELDLQDNNMDNLEFVKDRCGFAFIDLTGNPIHCDCSVWELIRYDDLVVVGTCPSPRQYEDLEIAGDEFKTAVSEACNSSKTEDGRCEWAAALDTETNDTSGTRDSTPQVPVCVVLAALVFQAIPALMYRF